MASIAERFWKKVTKTESCWLWIGSLNFGGYGRFWKGGGLIAAHRMSLELAGRHIPDGMVVDHLCRVRNCVNPEHLRIVTRKQNSLENSTGATARNAAKTHCNKGHLLAGQNLLLFTNGRIYRKCRTCKNEQRRHGNQ